MGTRGMKTLAVKSFLFKPVSPHFPAIAREISLTGEFLPGYSPIIFPSNMTRMRSENLLSVSVHADDPDRLPPADPEGNIVQAVMF